MGSLLVSAITQHELELGGLLLERREGAQGGTDGFDGVPPRGLARQCENKIWFCSRSRSAQLALWQIFSSSTYSSMMPYPTTHGRDWLQAADASSGAALARLLSPLFLAGTTLLLGSPASALVVPFSGDTTGQNTWSRPVANGTNPPNRDFWYRQCNSLPIFILHGADIRKLHDRDFHPCRKS